MQFLHQVGMVAALADINASRLVATQRQRKGRDGLQVIVSGALRQDRVSSMQISDKSCSPSGPTPSICSII